MATTIKVRGVTSATTATVATDGANLGSLVTVVIGDDGGITFADAASNQRRMDYSPELHALLELLSVGAGGVATTQGWFGNTSVAAIS